MAATRANQNRKIRQDALREQLSNQKLVEKVIDSIKEIDELASINIKDYSSAEEYNADVVAAKD